MVHHTRKTPDSRGFMKRKKRFEQRMAVPKRKEDGTKDVK